VKSILLWTVQNMFCRAKGWVADVVLLGLINDINLRHITDFTVESTKLIEEKTLLS